MSRVCACLAAGGWRPWWRRRSWLLLSAVGESAAHAAAVFGVLRSATACASLGIVSLGFISPLFFSVASYCYSHCGALGSLYLSLCLLPSFSVFFLFMSPRFSRRCPALLPFPSILWLLLCHSLQIYSSRSFGSPWPLLVSCRRLSPSCKLYGPSSAGTTME